MKSDVFSSRQGLKLLAAILLALGGLALLLSGGISLAQPFFSPGQTSEEMSHSPVTVVGISGTVTSHDGAPLSDVEVTALMNQPDGSWQAFRFATTDAAGHYAVVPLDTAIYRLRFWDNSGVYAFEYYSDALSLETASDVPIIGDMVTGIDASLSPAGYISGTVTMFDGQPPDWARVDLYVYNGSWWERIDYFFVNSTSNSYTFGGLASGVYRLYVEGNYQGNWYNEYYDNAGNVESATDITVTAGAATTNVNVVLGDDGSGQIAGQVTSVLPEGASLEGIRVTAFISRTWDWGEQARSTSTNVSGTYQLMALGAGTYAVHFWDPQGNYAFEYYSDTLTLANATPISLTEGALVSGINARLAPAGHISGTVTMFDGQPPDWGRVRLYVYNGFWWERIDYFSVDSASNSYTFGGLASGVYRLRVYGDYQGDRYSEYYDNADSLESATDITVTGGTATTNVNVVLGDDSSGQIAGQVTSGGGTGTGMLPEGASLEGIRVTAFISRTWDWEQARTTSTNVSGTYQLMALGAGTYAVHFWDTQGNYAFEYYSDTLTLANATPISLTEGALVSGINARLAPAGHISGTVTVFDGQPPDWGYVDLYVYNGFWWERIINDFYVNSTSNSYIFGGLASGVYRLFIEGYYRGNRYEEYYDNAGSFESATDIAVTVGATTSNINMVLGDNTNIGRISGTARAAGQPQADIRVELYQDYDGYDKWWRLVYADTDAQGNYSIGGLKDRRYKVRFSDPGGTYATVFYDGWADLASADVISIANGATVTNIDANLTAAGSVSGTVTLDGGGPGQDVEVVAYRYNGATWEELGMTNTGAGGQYTLGGLLPGDCRLYFMDPSRDYRSEYYDNVSSIISATDVAVITNTVTANIDAVLERPAAPVAQVSSSGGSVTVDPWTGQVTIMTTPGSRSDTTISTEVVCSGGLTPTSVTLWMSALSYPMTETPPGSGVYQATIPANDIANATLRVTWSCGSAAPEKIIGDIVLYDPSGYITDAGSGEPIAGATVTLYKVPYWLPDTDTETLNCRTVDTRSGADWSSEPDAELGLGVVVNPELDLINGTSEIRPTVNPFVTDAAGHYGWDVAQGCWYVAVRAQGYETRVSPVVGVPPEVTDLDLSLTPLLGEGRWIYVPLLLRNRPFSH